jgi:hypothetical protein
MPLAERDHFISTLLALEVAGNFRSYVETYAVANSVGPVDRLSFLGIPNLYVD